MTTKLHKFRWWGKYCGVWLRITIESSTHSYQNFFCMLWESVSNNFYSAYLSICHPWLPTVIFSGPKRRASISQPLLGRLVSFPEAQPHQINTLVPGSSTEALLCWSLSNPFCANSWITCPHSPSVFPVHSTHSCATILWHRVPQRNTAPTYR